VKTQYSFKKAAQILFRNLFHVERGIIFELDLTKKGKPAKAKIPLGFRWGTKNDILSMDRKRFGYGMRGKRYSINRLEKGDKFVVAIVDGLITGYGWVMFGEIELTKVWHKKLPAEKACLYKEFVQEPYRNMGINRARRTVVLDYLKQKGYKTAYIISFTRNAASVRSIKASGFQPIGRFYSLTLLGVEIPYIGKELLGHLRRALE